MCIRDRIIREEEDPRNELIKEFDLSEVQATSILDLRLRQLAKLEEEKLETERGELTTESAELKKILGSKARLKTLIKKELKAVAKETVTQGVRKSRSRKMLLPIRTTT